VSRPRIRQWLLLGAALSTAAMLIAGYNGADSLSEAYSGVQIRPLGGAADGFHLPYDARGRGIVEWVVATSPADQHGLVPGDTIISVDGMAPLAIAGRSPRYHPHNVGDTVTYAVERRAAVMDIRLRLVPRSHVALFQYEFFTTLLAAALMLLLGVTLSGVLTRHPAIPLLAAYCFAVLPVHVARLFTPSHVFNEVGVYTHAHLAAHGHQWPFWLFGVLLVTVLASAVAPALLLHFALIYPRTHQWLKTDRAGRLTLLYGVPLLLAPLSLTAILLQPIVAVVDHSARERLVGSGMALLLLVLLGLAPSKLRQKLFHVAVRRPVLALFAAVAISSIGYVVGAHLSDWASLDMPWSTWVLYLTGGSLLCIPLAANMLYPLLLVRVLPDQYANSRDAFRRWFVVPCWRSWEWP